MKPESSASTVEISIQAQRHLRFGWWSLLVFLSLGIALEMLHGFKVQYYLHLDNETRRFMWRLAHAHGTLLGLIHIAYAVSVPHLVGRDTASGRVVSSALRGASVLLPGGFFLGGWFFHEGDPGYFIFLVPIGAGLLFVAVLLTALAVGKPRTSGKHGR